MISVKNCKM